MQMLLFTVGEGVRDRILASDNISLNANLAKYRETLKQGGCEKTGTGARNWTEKTITKPPKAGLPNGALLFMTLFAKKKPPEPAAADEQKISLALTPDEIDLLRECMKRTEDYYRGLLLLKQDWNAAQNEAAIAMIKVRLNMIDKLQEKTLYDGQSEYYRNLQ